MAAKFRGYIPPLEAAYIELLLRDLDSTSRKVGLQRLSGFYRAGYKFSNPHPVKVVLLGLLNDESEKVARWALNGLALLGSGRDAEPIMDAVKRYRTQPDLLGAGVSALAALLPPEELTKALMKNELPLEGGVLLAAAQQNSLFDTKLRGLRLDIENAEPADLRLATLLVGLDRAPEHLFSGSHSNQIMIGELNAHDDPLVAQYSVWATVENPKLSLSDLRLALKHVEAQPANVRGWVYRLIASSAETANAHQDVLQTGSKDESTEAREGLAAGLREVVFPNVERFVVEWFLHEQSDAVRQRLLEHMAAHGHTFPRYEEIVLGIYRSAGKASLVRARLEAAARGTRLYAGMQMIQHDAERQDLFAANDSAHDPKSQEQAGFPDPTSIRVLIVTALPKEYAAVLATFDRTRTVGAKDDPNLYSLGVYSGDGEGQRERAVLVCQSGMGKANAASVGTNAIRSFPEAEHLLMVGIAGGCPNPAKSDEHVRLGDIVVSDDKGILEYDFVKETTDGREIRSHPQKPSRKLLGAVNHLASMELLADRPLDSTIEAALKRLAGAARPGAESDVLHDKAGNLLIHPDDAKRRDGVPRVFTGAVATSDTLQKNPDIRDMLRDRFGVRAIEMEASGMQSAAWAAGKDIIAVRGICDYCDPYKDDRWQDYAAVAAAAFTRTIVEAMPEEWFPE